MEAKDNLKSGKEVIKELSLKYGVEYEIVESIIVDWIKIEYLSLTGGTSINGISFTP